MNKSHYLLDYLGAIILVGLALLNIKHPGSLGGSIILSIVCAFFYILSVSYKKYQQEISFAVFLLAAIIGFNYVAYLEFYEQALSIRYAVILVLIFVLIIISFLVLIIGPTKVAVKTRQPESSESLEIRKRIYQRLFYPVYGFHFTLATGAIFSGFLIAQSPELYTAKWFRLSYHTMFWIIMSFVISLIALSRIPDYYIDSIIMKERIPICNVRRKLLSGYILIVVLGSICEYYRGLWVLWIESSLLLGIIILDAWKVWKHIFETEIYEVPKTKIDSFIYFDLLKNPRDLLIYLISSAVLLFIYLIGSVILLKS